MAVNKVVYGTTVLVDLTEDTVTPQTLLLGNRAHGRDGQIVEGTLTGSQTGVLVKLSNLDVTYVSATTARIDISGRTPIYGSITRNQIIVELTHFGLYATGLVFGGSLNTDVSISYDPATGRITLTTDSTAFNSSVSCKANVYITEQTPSSGDEKMQQSKTVTPSAVSQIVTPDSGYELTSVTVNPVTAELVASLDPDFAAANIREGVDILGLTGTLSTEGGGGGFDPSPWKNIVVGTITPTSAQTKFNADLSKGTPMGLIISLISTGNVAAVSNALISAAWSNNKIEPSTYGKGTAYYSSATNRTTTGTYPTYSNGTWNLSKSLRAGWTYYYCIIYGD